MIDLNHLIQLRDALLNRLGPDMALVTRSRVCDIRLSETMRSTAGRAYYKENIIKLNRRLLTDHPHHLDQTFTHELAHLVAYELYGAKGCGHGPLWRGVMIKFGVLPDRTHSLDTSKYKRKHAAVAMASCGCEPAIEIKARRFKRMIQGAKYRCRGCGQRLVLNLNNGEHKCD